MPKVVRLLVVPLIALLLAACGSDAAEPETTPSEQIESSQLHCDRTADLRGFSQALDTPAHLQAYVQTQTQALQEIAAKAPDRELRAGVNLKKLVKQNEIGTLLERHGLEWLNIYWESQSGEQGAISSSSGPQSIHALALDAGAYYAIVDFAPVSQLQELSEEEAVYVVDIGRIEELDAAEARRECIMFALPDPLWFVAQQLNLSLE